DAVPGASR
ncbi:putative ybl82, partial [Escherichia coli 88.0221]